MRHFYRRPDILILVCSCRSRRFVGVLEPQTRAAPIEVFDVVTGEAADLVTSSRERRQQTLLAELAHSLPYRSPADAKPARPLAVLDALTWRERTGRDLPDDMIINLLENMRLMDEVQLRRGHGSHR